MLQVYEKEDKRRKLLCCDREKLPPFIVFVFMPNLT